MSEKEDLLITCKSGIILRTPIANIKEAGRATQGVILIRLDDGDEIAAVSKVEEQQEDEKTDESNMDQNDNESETTNNQ